MISIEKSKEKILGESEERKLEIPGTLEGMERALGNVFLKMDDIEASSLGRDAEAETLRQIDYGTSILLRMKEFLKHENEAALSRTMKQIKKILDNKGGLADVKKLFEKKELAA